MTTKTQFATEEWNQLLQGATNVALYVSLASPGLIDSIKESYAAAKAMITATQEAAPNELMGALTADFKNLDAVKQARPTFEIKDIVNVKGQVLEAVRSTRHTLESKATSAEADYIKRWLYQVAVSAAEAATEDDFLGFGGTRVNDAEKDALRELAEALNLKI